MSRLAPAALVSAFLALACASSRPRPLSDTLPLGVPSAAVRASWERIDGTYETASEHVRYALFVDPELPLLFRITQYRVSARSVAGRPQVEDGAEFVIWNATPRDRGPLRCFTEDLLDGARARGESATWRDLDPSTLAFRLNMGRAMEIYGHVHREGEPARPCGDVGHEGGVLAIYAHIEVVTGTRPATFELRDGTHTVGRSRGCDIALREESVSRVHAEIRYENGTYVIEDQGGLNGVYVDGVRAEQALLRDGVLITLGKVTLRFVEGASESSTTKRTRAPRAPRATSSTAAERVLDQLTFGVILLSQGGAVAFANRAARALVERGDGLVLAGGVLKASDASVTRAFRGLLEQVTATGRGGALAIPRTSSPHPLAVLVTPLPASDSDGVGGASAALFLTDPDQGAGSCEEVMASLYDLTPAEARLTAELMQGKSLDEVATALAITVHTARSHLKRIFGKTGTRRQSELVRLLISSPAQLRGA